MNYCRKQKSELKEFKSELSILERKIQLELAPPDKSEQISGNAKEQSLNKKFG